MRERLSISSHFCPTCGHELLDEENWNGWIAVLLESQEEEYHWCIAPKEFWEKNKCIPDWSLRRAPKGFFETEEHRLDSCLSLPSQMQLLRSYGFEIVKVRERAGM